MERKSGSSLKAIDFFCGAGGMTKGMNGAEIKVLAGIDNDASCRQTYEVNNPSSKFIKNDINALTPTRLARLTGISKHDDSLIFIGCSPCQYWSRTRTYREKSEPTKNLLGAFEKFVESFRPGYIVVENVPGMYKKRDNNVLGNFLNFIENRSYNILHSDVIKSVNYGVPQTRERYLLIASRVCSSILIPQCEYPEKMIVKNFIGAKNGFVSIPAGHRDNTDFRHTAAGLSEKNLKRIRLTRPDGGTRYQWKDDPDLQIPTYQGRDAYFRNVYGRMFWNKPAPTITTRFHSLSNGRFGHPEEDRALSLREGATLQTFPKDYLFFGSSIGSIAQQIGNAVPPQLAKRIGEAIIKSRSEK